MKRTGPSLSEIPRHELVAAALELGIERPEELSPEQLRDKIRAASSPVGAAEGVRVSLFSVARSLIASVVERGLNLPDAARVIRDTVRPSPRHRPPLPTVTLAQIYLAQGYTDRALQTLTSVIDREPNNYNAVELYQRLTQAGEESLKPSEREGAASTVERASVAPGPAPAAELWYTPAAPPTRGVRDALVVLERTGKEVTVYWELADRHGDSSSGAAEVRVYCYGPQSSAAQSAPREVNLPVRSTFGWAIVELLDNERPRACLTLRGRVVASALHVRPEQPASDASVPLVLTPRRGFWQDVVQRALQ